MICVGSGMSGAKLLESVLSSTCRWQGVNWDGQGGWQALLAMRRLASRGVSPSSSTVAAAFLQLGRTCLLSETSENGKFQ